MLSPKSPRKPQSPSGKVDRNSPSPNPRATSPAAKGSSFKPKTLSDLKPVKPS
jgi:hypothetical protein